MPANLRFATYDNDSRLYVVNPADRAGDPSDAHPAIRQLQTASRAVILRACRNPDNVVVKVTDAGPHYTQVRGYVTLASFLKGANPQELERRLGMRSGALSGGCRVHQVDSRALTVDNIGPRYMTSWPAGVSPRDLDLLSQRVPRPVDYHRDYPPASEPIAQFVLYRPVPTVRSVVLTGHDQFSHL